MLHRQDLKKVANQITANGRRYMIWPEPIGRMNRKCERYKHSF